MRSRALVATCVLVGLVALVVSAPEAGARVAGSIDECRLLTDAQARTIMGAEPYAGGVPDNGGCSWETDPTDRLHLAYVTLKVESRSKLLARYGNDLRRYLDESTTVGIDPLPGVGDEAFSTYSALSGPGSSDGIDVLVGKRVISLGLQPVTKVANPSPVFDRIVGIVKKVVRKVRRA